MTAAEVTQPTTIRELTRYVQDTHPDLDTSYNGDLDQLLLDFARL